MDVANRGRLSRCLPCCVTCADSPADDEVLCFGPEHLVALTLVPLIRMTDGTSVSDYLNVYAARDGENETPYVFLGRGEGGELVKLSPLNAASLVEALRSTLTELAT